ncbi:radical SAM protein [Desulfoluna butyratoxydans]|uniref:Elp3/MiaA/NifB-like radical SAM core domain-containing protein n=1 Tax=Desulfoluna butyratoxydans TaxID=231438 RepID=A0A4U8YXU1_9BACT|nr:radical SAM protein [Desulfoluna butyratoxydans]VFQ46293.1 hypothetical protein MSL71_39560 [Desulfoluna butyratoxydans]
MPTFQAPVTPLTRDMAPEDTPVDAFTRFFRKAKSLGCFPRPTNASPSCAFGNEGPEPYATGGLAPVTGPGARSLWHSLSEAPLHPRQAATLRVPFGTGTTGDEIPSQIPVDAHLSTAYADAVMCDIMRDGARLSTQGNPIHAFLVNGGIPTALAPSDLARIIEAARRNLPLANDCEITVEGHIADMTPEMARAITRAGVNRVSLDLLSFHTPLRQAMGRRADGKEAANTLSELISSGQATVNVGLTYGLSGQSADMFQQDLETLVSLNPDGIDLIPHVPLQGRDTDLIREQYALFEKGSETLAATTCRHLYAGHWACTPRERNLSSFLASQQAPSIPFGCGAEGFVDGHRVLMTDRLDDYLNTAGREKPVAMILAPVANHRLASLIRSQMQTLALDLSGLGRHAGESSSMALLPLIHCWADAGLVRIEGHILRPTTAGEYWHATLTRGLIDYLALYEEMGCPEPCV